MIPYFIIFFLLVVLPLKNINKFAFILLLMFLSIRYNIGSDFPTYYKLGKEYEMFGTPLFVTLNDYLGGEGYLYYRVEFLNRILYQITWYLKNPQVLIFLYSFLQLYFIKKGLDKQNIFSKYPWILFFSFPIFMFSYMSIMRQAVAMSIVFYNYNNIIKKQYFKSFVFMIIAFLFHNSALCGLALYLTLLNIKIKIKYLLFLEGIFLGFFIFLKKFGSNFSFLEKYVLFFTNNVRSGGGKVFYLILLISIFLMIFYKKILEYNKNDENLLNIVLVGSIFYLNIYLMGDIASRIGVYFIFFILYIIDDIINIFNNKRLMTIMFVFCCFFLMNISLYLDSKNSCVLSPYKVYFQEVDKIERK